MSDLFDFKVPTRRYALMGNPVSHSRSPFIHLAFGEQVSVDIEYTLIQVDHGGFTQAVDNFRASGGEGLNVTVPFKSEAARYADSLSQAVTQAGAANTLVFADDQCTADNTDGVGLINDLSERLGVSLASKRVLLIGAGGAAKGAAGPLLDQNIAQLTIANRSVDKAYDIADHLNHDRLRACGFDDLSEHTFDVVINATSASLSGALPAVPASALAGCELVYDMMYASELTPFLRWAESHGCQHVADGLGMLVEQAAESFRIWTGEQPATQPVFEALRTQL